MKVIELCCGYGGATAGVLAAGLEYKAAYDLWPLAVDAHKRWHPDVPAEVLDVATLTDGDLEDAFVWASLPCQPWSVANRRVNKRGKAHPSYYSLAHFAWQVRKSQVAILENVPGLLTEKDGQQEIAELVKACARLNLSLSIHLIPAFWYGVPQLRRRAVIIINGPMVLFEQPRTVGHIDGGAVLATEGKGGSRRIPARFDPSTGDKRGLNRAPMATESSSHTSTNPSTGEVNSWGRGPEECARLQGLPFEPIAHLPKTHQHTLIGNAVPPRFAEGIVRTVIKSLEKAQP